MRFRTFQKSLAPHARATAAKATERVSGLLVVRNVYKRYGSVQAVDDVSLHVDAGEIRGILGENGAGKTTLMSVIAGVAIPDSGTVRVNSAIVRPGDPQAAIRAGIAMVHQHSKLVDAFTLSENLALMRTRQGIVLDVATAGRRLAELSHAFGLSVHPASRVEELPIAERQRAEILRALLQDPKVLILDEPTALLAPHERDQVMALIRQLARNGTAIILLSHHLKEIIENCESVTVMRRGKVVFTARTSDTSMQKLAEAMVGRPIGSDLGAVRVQHTPQRDKAAVLSVQDLSVPAPDGSRMEIRDFSLTLHESELVAIVGVEGNGQDALMGALSGLRPHSGEVRSQGSVLPQCSPKERIANNISRIPGDRHTEGLSLTLPVWENLLLGRRQMWKLENRFGFISRGRAHALARDLISRFDIRVANLNVTARTASGGNQQKIVLARELSVSPSVVLAMNPTRGLDIASANFVHGHLLSEAEQKAAVLLITSNLDEALTLAHRILVLFRGAIVADYTPEFDRSEIGLAMGGVGIAI